MATTSASRSWADQLADLEDPTPKELDPEDNREPGQENSGSDVRSVDGACAHYVPVDKSKLRKRNDELPSLGAQYAGSRISRDALLGSDDDSDPFGSEQEQDETEQYADPDGGDLAIMEVDGDEEIESDNAFASGDDQRFGEYTFQGSRALGKGQDRGESLSKDSDPVNWDGDDNTGFSSEELNGGASDSDVGNDTVAEKLGENNIHDSNESDTDGTSTSEKSEEPAAGDRAALRKMMAEEHKTVAASLSQAARADLEKGRALKHQRTTFDTLLNTRIKLQKALIATNSLSASPTASKEHTDTIQAAEAAALKLWNSLSSLRSSIQTQDSKTSSLSATTSTPSSSFWSHMQSQEKSRVPNRRANLIKWSQKTNPALALPHSNKFSQAAAQQPLTSALDQQLSGSNGEKLVNKTRIPRSCAPVQAAARTTEDPNIYDDADFYTVLLRELVDQRMADSSNSMPAANGRTALPSLPSQRDFKVKKQVDTKASKGRKLRYTVHEKLQNFMAPDDRGTWGERQRNELFGSLLGRRVKLSEDEDEIMSEEEDAGGLKLFG